VGGAAGAVRGSCCGWWALTAALDAYKAAMAAARAVFDGPQTADDYRAAYATWDTAKTAAYLAYDRDYQAEVPLDAERLG